MPVKKKLKELLAKLKKANTVDLEAIKRMERVAQAARDAAKTDKAQ
jgi:hypothetical protein